MLFVTCTVPVVLMVGMMTHCPKKTHSIDYQTNCTNSLCAFTSVLPMPIFNSQIKFNIICCFTYTFLLGCMHVYAHQYETYVQAFRTDLSHTIELRFLLSKHLLYYQPQFNWHNLNALVCHI